MLRRHCRKLDDLEALALADKLPGPLQEPLE
jgi:hypothetical protein